MDKQFLTQLTNKLYQLTLLFPKKEPLRYKMRDTATDILANSLLVINQINQSKNKTPSRIIETYLVPVLDKFEIMAGFFEVAKAQNWLKQEQILSLEQQYSKLREELKNLGLRKEENQKNKQEKNLPTEESENQRNGELKKQKIKKGKRVLSARQQRIITLLKERGRAQVAEVQNVLTGVTKRTLRRDFKDLVEQGLVERVGERQETYYKLKSKVKSQNYIVKVKSQKSKCKMKMENAKYE